MASLLSIEHLSVEYHRGGTLVPAVQDVSLHVESGEVVGLVGESGSGKSTIALAILRLIRAQEGRIAQGKIIFEGSDVLALPEESMRTIRGARIAMVFQDPFTSLNPVLRIREQMEEILIAHDRVSSREILMQSLEQVQLDAARVLDAYPHQLSGGQRQRVLIASALLGQPKLLLADEPTTALDVIVQKSILDLLFKLQSDLKLAMIFISHNLSLIAQHAQRIVVLKQGSVVEEGAALGVFQSPKHPYTKLLLESIRELHDGAKFIAREKKQ